MSGENVEVMRRWFEGMNAALAAPEQGQPWLARFCDEDIDYYPVSKFPEAQPSHGLEEIVR